MKTILTAFLLIITTAIHAQGIDTRKYIEVTGSAEMTIQPDEIELEIVLGENKKVGGRKIDDIEADFNSILRKNNIKPESVKFDNASSWYWWAYWKNRNQLNMRTVHVTLDHNTDIFKFVKDLNQDWVRSISIASSDHKDMPRFRKEVKIQAMKAAKEKASYLLESVGEKAGGILSVEEMPDNGTDSRSQMRLQSNSVEYAQSQGIDNVAEIKLRYEIKVKFAVQ